MPNLLLLLLRYIETHIHNVGKGMLKKHYKLTVIVAVRVEENTLICLEPLYQTSINLHMNTSVKSNITEHFYTGISPLIKHTNMYTLVY